MDEIITHKDTPTVLTEIPRYAAPAEPVARPLDRPRIPTLNLVLLLLTFLTTTTAGAYMNGEEVPLLHPLLAIAALRSGLSFSIPLVVFLFTRERAQHNAAPHNIVAAAAP